MEKVLELFLYLYKFCINSHLYKFLCKYLEPAFGGC